MTTISIIVPTLNEEKYIGRCLAGILSQKYPMHLVEIILIDDASGDKTLSIAKNILGQSKVRHKIIENKTKKGKKPNSTIDYPKEGYVPYILIDERLMLKAFVFLKVYKNYFFSRTKRKPV